MIDLHIHTTSSDGSDEPEGILVKAQQAGLKYISITDHDSIGAYKKLKQVKINSYFEGRLIPGCEFSVMYRGKQIEILGYGIDLDTIDSAGIVSDEKFLERENGHLRKLMGVCKNLNIKYSDYLSIKNGRFFSTQVFHADIRNYPENEKHFTKETWESLNAFYRTCVCDKKSPFFIDQTKDCLTINEATDIIKKAGGRAFLAHLYGYFEDDYEEFLNSLVTLNVLDGIECYHSLHDMDRTKYLLNYCSEHRLYAAGGSDYHGKIKPNVKIGESIPCVKIPYEILEPWLPDNII